MSKVAREPVGKRLRFEVLKRDGFCCQYCRASGAGVVLHVDHVVPVAAGGASVIDNLVTACDTCNLGKSDRPLSRFLVKGERLTKHLEQAEVLADQLALLLDAQRISWYDALGRDDVPPPSDDVIIIMFTRYESSVATLAIREFARKCRHSKARQTALARPGEYYGQLNGIARLLVGKRWSPPDNWRVRARSLGARVSGKTP